MNFKVTFGRQTLNVYFPALTEKTNIFFSLLRVVGVILSFSPVITAEFFFSALVPRQVLSLVLSYGT